MPSATAYSVQQQERVDASEHMPWDVRDLTSDDDLAIDTLTREQPEEVRRLVEQPVES